MNPPATIKILHLTFDLVFVDPSISEQAQAFGWCDKVRQKIFIQSNLKPRSMVETILHEVYHSIFSACGIPTELTEEQACSMLSGPMLLVMLENKDLLLWIQSLL